MRTERGLRPSCRSRSSASPIHSSSVSSPSSTACTGALGWRHVGTRAASGPSSSSVPASRMALGSARFSSSSPSPARPATSSAKWPRSGSSVSRWTCRAASTAAAKARAPSIGTPPRQRTVTAPRAGASGAPHARSASSEQAWANWLQAKAAASSVVSPSATASRAALLRVGWSGSCQSRAAAARASRRRVTRLPSRRWRRRRRRPGSSRRPFRRWRRSARACCRRRSAA